MSFVARFLEWLTGPLVFLWLAAVAFALTLAWHASDIPYDNELEYRARGIASTLKPTGNAKAPLELSKEAQVLLQLDRHGSLRWAVRRLSGEIILGDEEIPPVAGQIENGLFTFQNGVIGDDSVRFIALIAADPSQPGGEMVVEVAETLANRHAFARSLQAQALFPQVIVLVGAGFLVWYGLAVVIRPMARLRRSVDARSPTDLRPLDVGAAPAEIVPLVEAINGLMKRLAANYDAQQRFTADAAHQLRSPLAALALQTEQALAETDPERQRRALEQVVAAAHRTAHLANRLLALARARAVNAPAFNRVDLAAIAREAVGDAAREAARRGIDLGIDAAPAAVIVDGDALLLREMAANLIDNAIRYTPRGGSVTVSVAEPPTLCVADTGPGIAETERTRIFEPFVRGRDNVEPGSGLGLAIVRSIVQSHEATIDLTDGDGGRGAVFRVRFPPAHPL